MSPPAKNFEDGLEKVREQPFQDLVSLKDLRASIPEHLFERSLFWGLFITARVLIISAIWVCFQWWLTTTPLWTESHWALVAILDLVMIIAGGTVHTGAWSLAHECGHGATTPYTLVNDVIGFVLHTALIVPYFPWQQSHAQHHSRNHHITQGESHRPERAKKKTINRSERSTTTAIFKMVKRSVVHPIVFVLALVVGWRVYLTMGMTGAEHRPDGKKIKLHSHHNPASDLFPDSYPRWKIWISNIALAIPLYGWFLFQQEFGWLMFLRIILGPQMVVDAWLNAITKAQHSHPKIRYMDPKIWNWYRGAIQTIDYSYGPIIDFLHLNIGPAHVAHHIWPRAPAYNGPEMTKHLKEKLGKFYIKPKKSACETIFANTYKRVSDEPDADGFYDWVGLFDPDKY